MFGLDHHYYANRHGIGVVGYIAASCTMTMGRYTFFHFDIWDLISLTRLPLGIVDLAYACLVGSSL